MELDQIKNRLAPCGLHCGKCFAFVDGGIRNLKMSEMGVEKYYDEIKDKPRY